MCEGGFSSMKRTPIARRKGGVWTTTRRMNSSRRHEAISKRQKNDGTLISRTRHLCRATTSGSNSTRTAIKYATPFVKRKSRQLRGVPGRARKPTNPGRPRRTAREPKDSVEGISQSKYILVFVRSYRRLYDSTLHRIRYDEADFDIKREYVSRVAFQYYYFFI